LAQGILAQTIEPVGDWQPLQERHLVGKSCCDWTMGRIAR